jgi:pyruvate,water dikinase
MTTQYALPLADSGALLATAGGKGASLARLAAADLPVPDGFHLTTAAYRDFVAENDLQLAIMAALERVDVAQPETLDNVSSAIRELFANAPIPESIGEAVAEAYEQLDGDHPLVAVRSSATAEDLPELSFAGQQESYLNICGREELIGAVRRCWASLWTARAIGYRARNEIASEAISLAVIVQLMVPAEASGVLFTANPLNGRCDQAVINAAWGLGEAIVGGQVTPDTLTLDKVDGRVLERDIADKRQMTTGLQQGTEIRQVPQALRQEPVLDDAQASELVEIGVQIERLFGGAMDIEWALAGGRFSIVQARPITALPEPEAEAPTDWPLPDPDGKYMRTSIIDLMPDPLTPLFGTLGLAALNAGLVRLAGQIAKAEPVFPDDTMVLINDYVYMKVQFTRREWLWMRTRMTPGFPRMLRTGISVWRDEARPAYLGAVARWGEQPPAGRSPAELLAGVHEILEEAVDHLGSLMAGTMGVSAGSENLFTQLYRRLVRRDGDPAAPTFLMGYDTTPIQAEKSLYDLAQWCRAHADLAAFLLATPAGQLAEQLGNGRAPAGVDEAEWGEWRALFQEHVGQYGHIIYDLDFAKPLPLDDPTPMIDTCKMYLRGEGSNPHERQRNLERGRIEATEAVQKRIRGLRRKLFDKSLSWAQSLAEVREDGIADIGLGYPMLRELLLELGRRFAQAGAVEQPGDIFWLTHEELENATAALEQDSSPDDLAAQVGERKALWRAEKRVTPPPQLSVGSRYLGVSTDNWLAADAGSDSGNTIKGLGASPGRVVGTARVLEGPEDFNQLNHGDVLVASITTPAWTPLFARAAAIVTDVGGPLSHGSIVAREYGIPAVLGTGVATRRIESGQLITVDGDSGLVTLPNGEGPES